MKDNYFNLYIKYNNGNLLNDLYDYLNNITKKPICKTCGNTTKFDTFLTGYAKYCSHKCSVRNRLTLEKRKNTNLKKYGVSNTFLLEKRNRIMIERYGSIFPLQNRSLLKKKMKTLLNKSNEEKLKIKEKRKNTNLKRYGIEYPIQLKEFKEKVKKTNLKRYGVDWVQKSKLINNKSIKVRQHHFYESLHERCFNAVPLFNKTQFKGVRYKYLWKCKTCSNNFYDHMDDGSLPICPFCNPGNSKGEQELIKFINSLNINFIVHDKSLIYPKELDIYIPNKKVAIEYCGLYWHSENKILDKYYHQKKYLNCEKNDVKLITIFEDEWLFKKEIIKRRLKNILENNKYASTSNIKIKSISKKEYLRFLKKYALSKPSISNYRFGCFMNNELVGAVGGLYSGREYMILDYYFSIDLIDIENKISKYIINKLDIKKIKMQINLNWPMCIFKNGSISEPNCWFSKNGIYKHRYEKNENNYYKIWDCGNLTYEFNNHFLDKYNKLNIKGMNNGR